MLFWCSTWCMYTPIVIVALTPLIKIPKSFSCHFAFNVKVLAEIKYCKSLMWTGWFRSTLGFDLLGFRSILVSICTRYQFQTAHYSIYTNSDLHSFRSALFSLCNFWICKDFALLSIRSAQISICTDFDLHVFRYANQF